MAQIHQRRGCDLVRVIGQIGGEGQFFARGHPFGDDLAMPVEKLAHGFSFRIIGQTRERDAVSGFDLFVEVAPGRPEDPRRNVTTTPLQALNLLNSELTLKWAEGFAARVLRSAGRDLGTQIDAAYRIAFARRPDNSERETVRKFFDRHREIIAVRAAAGEELALPPELPAEADRVEVASLVDFCHMLINANEFVYRN